MFVDGVCCMDVDTVLCGCAGNRSTGIKGWTGENESMVSSDDRCKLRLVCDNRLAEPDTDRDLSVFRSVGTPAMDQKEKPSESGSKYTSSGCILPVGCSDISDL